MLVKLLHFVSDHRGCCCWLIPVDVLDWISLSDLVIYIVYQVKHRLRHSDHEALRLILNQVQYFYYPWNYYKFAVTSIATVKLLNKLCNEFTVFEVKSWDLFDIKWFPSRQTRTGWTAGVFPLIDRCQSVSPVMGGTLCLLAIATLTCSSKNRIRKRSVSFIVVLY